MLIKEFEEEVKKLSDKYDFSVAKELDGHTVHVKYADKLVLIIYSSQFSLTRIDYSDKFERLPFSHKLWMLASELAMTPYNERFEQRYNVIVGEDRTSFPYTVWAKNGVKACLLATAGFKDLQEDDDYQFTDSEFKDLIKYIKTLPNGKFQAKVAEHGKQLVKEE